MTSKKKEKHLYMGLSEGDLWQNWTAGRDVFDRLLLDADWAVNNGNLQQDNPALIGIDTPAARLGTQLLDSTDFD